MIKGSSTMPSMRSLLLNGAGVLLIGATLVGVVRATFFPPSLSSCSERYHGGVAMSLERDGRPLHVSELQAQLSGTDWNLLDNARVVGLRAGPARQAIEYRTPVQPPSGAGDAKPGIGFVWRPASLPQTIAAACLAYHIFVPESFDFAAGGRLPGLLGGKPDEAPSREPAFALRIVFDERGKVDLALESPERSGGIVGNTVSAARIEAGSWTRIEQELVLDAPGSPNGSIRVWINGTLTSERTGLSIRKDSEASISGVMAEVLRRSQLRREPKPAAVWLTPFDVRWTIRE